MAVKPHSGGGGGTSLVDRWSSVDESVGGTFMKEGGAP